MEKSNINNPVIIFGIALLLLIFNSYAPEGLNFFGQDIKQVDFLSDIRTDDFYDSADDEESYENDEYYEESEEEYDNESEKEDESAIHDIKAEYNIASIINVSSFLKYVNAEAKNYYNTAPITSKDNLSGNLSQLNKFFTALKSSKSKQVRIAHFGDSTLEGDLISADLRAFFQKKFGGKGVGLVPITSKDVAFRSTTDLSFSNDWITASFSKNRGKLPLGINGHAFANSDGSWVELKTTNRYKTVKKFDVAKLFYSNPKSGAKVEYSLNGKAKVTKTLSSSGKINVLEVKKSKSKSIKFIFPGAKSATYYGVSLEGSTGVYLDNFALRGNSGVGLKKIKKDYIKSFNDELDYKLVILEFGLNALKGKNTNFTRYERTMIKIIKKLKSAIPSASFILVGVHDKSIKKGSKFITDPAVPKLVEAQKRIAKATGIAFWNLFEAMGGKNSMVKWVSSNPRKAFKDYIHFNEVGTKTEAKMIFDELMSKYK